jgi:large subunit ribosomal protein L17
MHEHIETTEPRAKEARVLAEHLITLAKQNTVHARRQARKALPPPHMPKGMLSMHGKAQKDARQEVISQDPVKRLFDVVAPKFAEKQSGFTRIIKIGFRRGDAAPMVKLELAVD